MKRAIATTFAAAAATVLALALHPQLSFAAATAESAGSQRLATGRAPDPNDLAWTTSGDASGLHVLAATAMSGYAWRTVATLAEPGFDTDRWIGNACMTGSARRLVVVYAPRAFTNRAELFDRSGFVATVDLVTGHVRKLPVVGTLAYFNPGCGTGETAVITQSGGHQDEFTKDHLGTRLFEVDAQAGTVSGPIAVKSDLTSAIPTREGIVAAGGSRLVKVERDGRLRGLARTSGTPFHLKAAADGGVVFMDREGATGAVRHVQPKPEAKSRLLAQGPLMDLGVAAGASGRLLITGRPKTVHGLPASVSQVDIELDAQLSSHGALALTETAWLGTADARVPVADPSAPREVRVAARFLETGQGVEFRVKPGEGPGTEQGLAQHPKLFGAGEGGAGIAASPTDPVETERWCSIPRNDPGNQAMQPKPRQVEWAIDQAVMNALYVQRPQNWKNLNMAAYQPQQLFPPTTLNGGGRVPAQIALGVAAQESNLWQASFHALPGVTANPLIGNFYGRNVYDSNPGNDWDIDWTKADCGYGVMQITDGMRIAAHPKPGEVILPEAQQRAIALDFAANVAKGVRMLQDKWNLTRAYGLTINSGDPGGIEHWFFAIWAYNSGFYTPNGSEPWGVGWANNPVNPKYPANRPPFMEYCYCDAANPQRWPYPEKVIGFAAHPPGLLEGPDTEVPGFRAAWWPSVENRIEAKPPVELFCNATNDCYPGQQNLPDDPEVIGEPAGPCAHKNPANNKYDLKCWFHQAASWKEGYEAGNELLRFDPGYAYQDDATTYAPICNRTGLPANALVIDDVPDAAKSVRPNCVKSGWTNAGRLDFTFSPDSTGKYPSKVDFHQIGGGFYGHFWFAHTRKQGAEGGKMKVTGVWRFTNSRSGWGRIWVHIPDHGAHTQQARYEIDTGNGQFLPANNRYIPQRTQEHRWVSLGVYQFAGIPRVRLATETRDGYGEEDVAWDAVALEPLSAKPKNMVVALGDSYSSGEGAGNYYRESDTNYGTEGWNACRRSKDSWVRKAVLPGLTSSIGALADNRATNLDLAFLACGGGRIRNVLNWAPNSWTDPSQYWYSDGQFREIAQLESGFVNENTTLVTISAGGNDADFPGVLMECGNITDCSDKEAQYRTQIDNMIPRVDSLIESIKVRTNNKALIAWMGYPKLFSDTVKCAGSWYFDGTEADMLNRLAVYMSGRIAAVIATKVAAGVKVVYADPIAEWEDHGACDSVEYLNKFVDGPTGPGDNPTVDDDNPLCAGRPGTLVLCISRASFHPNTAGTSAYARVLQSALSGRYSGA